MLLVQQNICPFVSLFFYYQLVRKLQKFFFLTNMLNVSRKYKRSVLQKRPLHHIPVDVHECNLRFVKQESQMLLGWADRTAYIRRPTFDFRSWKENNFPEWLQSRTRNGDAAISNVQSTPEYDTVIRRTWVMAAGSTNAFKIAAKPLYRYFWQAIVSCRGTISRYHSRLPPNTCFMDRQSTYRTQGST